MQQALHLSFAPLARAAAATLVIAGMAAQPANAANKPVKFTIKPLSAHFESIDTMSARFVIKMKGDMTVEGKRLPMDGTMDVKLDVDVNNDRARMVYGGDLFEKMISGAVGKAEAKKFKNMSFALFIENGSGYVEMTAPQVMCNKLPESGDLGKLQEAFTQEMTVSGLSQDKIQTVQGTLIGEEKINGVATKRYKLTAAELKKMSKGQKGARYTAAEVWVANDGDYLVQLQTSGTGLSSASAFASSSGTFKGSMSMVYTLNSVNKPLKITLPASCKGESS
jgi:hypothetical protein